MKNIRLITIIYFLAGGLILSAVFNFSPSFNNSFFAAFFFRQPLFINTDNFVLFADQEIELAQDVQISSGDLGSNNKLGIGKNNIISANLFAKEISVDKDTTINGNASFNKLRIKKESRILGATATPVSLPIANLPDIPPFSVGNQDFSFQGENNTFNQGNYRNVILEKDSRLALTGGTYNLRKLELKENSFLIYNSPTTVNIQSELKTRQHIAILPGNNNLEPLDLTVNYQGKATIDDKDKDEDEDEDEDEDNNDNNNDDDGNDDENKKTKSRFQNFRERLSRLFKKLFGLLKKTDDQKDNGVRPVQFGNDSFLNFKLLAPKASVKLGDRTTFRGQILSGEVKIGKDSILSLAAASYRVANLADIITDPDGGVYPINEILVSLEPGATFADAQRLADEINGRIIGIVSSINLYQIEIPVGTIQDLETLIDNLRGRTDLKVDGVFRDFLMPIDI